MAFERFAEVYKGRPPWDIGRPQAAIVEVADEVRGAVVDLGCGTGEHALFFARRGQEALGIDFVPASIARAKAKAAERGSAAEFMIMDVLDLAGLPRQYDSGIDSGLFHTLADEERPRYLRSLGHAIRPGGQLFLLCFSDQVPGVVGPRRVAQEEIRETFATGWEVERIAASRFEIAPGAPLLFSGGVPAWLAVIRRSG